MPKIMKNGIEYGGGGEIYEEGEIKIGTFLGKDLYRKVIKLNQAISTDSYYEYSMHITGYVVKADALFTSFAGTENSFFIGSAASSGAGSVTYSNTNATAGKFVIRQATGTSATVYCKALILEYTKEKWN